MTSHLRRRYPTLRATILAAAFSSGAVVGCPESESNPKPDHCWFNEGNDTCPNDKPYCVGPGGDECSNIGNWDTNGCTDVRPPDQCYSPCGGEKLVTEDDSCLQTAEGDGDGDGDGDDMTGDGDGAGDGDGDGETPCEEHEDCTDPGAPFCDADSGECVDCEGIEKSDLACEEANASTPVCLDGSCVQCVEGKEDACGGVTPICDVVASMCVGCSDHGQCSGSACNFADGSCIDPANIVHVNGTMGVNCLENGGSEANPYCTIKQALDGVDAGSLIIVHERLTSPFVYLEINTISIPVAIFAAPGEDPVIQGELASTAITVAGSGNLFMRGITIAGTQNNGRGLVVNGGNAWIEQSKIVNNTGGAIVVQGGGMLVLENSFVGQPFDDVSAVNVVDGTFNIVYSTLAAGNDFGGTAHALMCDGGNGSIVRNSFLVSQSNSPEVTVQCNPTLTNNALEGMFDGNTSVGNLQPGWFVSFANGDYKLNMPPNGLSTAAKWQTGDPTTDIDGTPRPTTDGSDDYAGADRP